MADLLHVVPEMVLAAGMVLVLLAGFWKLSWTRIWWLAFLVLVADLLFSADFFYPEPQTIFSGMLRVSSFAAVIRMLLIVSGLLTMLLAWIVPTERRASEYYFLLLAMVWGGQWLTLSNHFVSMLVSFEILSITGYLLVNFGFDQRSAEGSLKYFLFGAAATALMIYGASMLYGLTGTLDFASSRMAEQLADADRNLTLIAGLALMAGFLFKIAAAPFHFWAPDVYESLPWPMLALFSTVPKFAGLAALLKVLLSLHAFGLSPVNWTIALGAVATLTLIAGNFAALWQQDTRRLMAWSSVAQSGFMLISLASLSATTGRFLVFYMAAFAAGNFLTVHGLALLEKRTGSGRIDAYAGQGMGSVWSSVALTLGLISLTGLPPVVGFTAKLFLFAGLWEIWQQSGAGVHLILFVFGLLNTVVALFFYLKVPYQLFLKPVSGAIISARDDAGSNLFRIILVVWVLWAFFQPGLLMGWLNNLNFDL